MVEVIGLSFAFVFGVLVKQIGLPPLVGFLAAGFALNIWGPMLGMPAETGPILEHVAHLGVLLLLFTVGLKLKIKNLVEPVVVGGALLHFTVTVAVFFAGFQIFLAVPVNTALLLAVALSFSSTVLAAKVLEAKRELRVLHGRVAIGILVIQDLIALVVLSLAAGQEPTVWAFSVFLLPLLRPLLYGMLDLTEHDEMLVVMGMVLAIVVGGMGFQVVGLSSELGALAMGVMLSGHSRSTELSESLWGLKEIFLVGFFLQIGMNGLPTQSDLLFALALTLALPVKAAVFYGLLVLFRLRARNAFLGALSLTCYSEFGLIVAARVLPDYLVPLAVSVALSFVVAAPLNRFAHPLYDRLRRFLEPLERQTRHLDEQPVSLGDASVLILGMGRTGAAAYDQITARGMRVRGLDADPAKVAMHAQAGRNVVYADAEDVNLWHGLGVAQLKAVILAMPEPEGLLKATRELRKLGYEGPVIANALYQDVAIRARAAGADETYLTMQGAGMGLANIACQYVSGEKGQDRSTGSASSTEPQMAPAPGFQSGGSV